jgi:hypothetical protein
MFFLLRMAFWLSVVLVLLPSGGSQQHTATAPSAELGAMETISAASATVSDMRQFCTRQPEACAIGSQAAAAIGQRAQAGAKMVYDFLSEHSVRGEPTGVTNGTGHNWPVSQDTLIASDLEPAWHGPPAQAEMVPMPRRNPRRSHKA